MFRGSFEHTVDSKGRVSVPSKFRDIIADRYEGKLVLAMDFDKCLTVYPLEEWEKLEEKIKSLPMMKQEVKDFMRFFFSSATECELDKQGRILIPPAHREQGGDQQERAARRHHEQDRDLGREGVGGTKFSKR